jgi:ComEC/Rec2-related protein
VGLIGICAAALVGLAAGDLIRLDAARLLAAASAALLGAALAWRGPAWRLLALATCAAALGAARASTAAGLAAPPPLVGGPYASDGSRYRGPGASGAGIGDDARGDRSVASEPQPSSPASPDRPANAPPLASLIGDARGAIERGVRRNLPEPQASLALGVLLGGSGKLDAGMRVQLQRSGLAHLVAIDGLKQVLVATALGRLSARLIGPFLGALPTLAGIAGYTLLTGGHPSAVRAGLMVGLATVASLTGRISDPLTSLLLAVVLMAVVQPPVLLDVGLQLSLSATLGIVLLWPRLRRRLRGLPRWIAEPVGLTLAVSLATLPLMVSTFQLVSLVSPLAHVVALPLLSAVLVTAVLLVLASPLAPLGAIVGWLAWLPATLLVAVIRFFGSWPAAAVSTGRLAPLAALCLAAGLLAWGAWGLPELHAARLALVGRGAAVRRWGAPVACVASVLATRAMLGMVRPDGQLHVDRLALARGEAVFVRGPTGQTVLLVRGPAEALSLQREVADHLALWEHKLDAAVQLDAGAANALALIMTRYPADRRLVLASQAHPRIDAPAAAPATGQASSGGRNEAAGQVYRGDTRHDQRWVSLADPSDEGAQLDLGGGAVLEVTRPDGQVVVRSGAARSAPTISGARPGSAD